MRPLAGKRLGEQFRGLTLLESSAWELPLTEPTRRQSVRERVDVYKVSFPGPKEEWSRVRGDLEGHGRQADVGRLHYEDQEVKRVEF